MNNLPPLGHANRIQPSAPVETGLSNGSGQQAQAQNSFQAANRNIAIGGGGNVRPPAFNPNYRFPASAHTLEPGDAAASERPSKMPRF